MIRTAWNWILARLFGPEEDFEYTSTTSLDERSIGTPYSMRTHADWLRRDLSILRDYNGIDLERGVGKSLSMLADRLEPGECKCGKRPRHTYVDGDTI